MEVTNRGSACSGNTRKPNSQWQHSISHPAARRMHQPTVPAGTGCKGSAAATLAAVPQEPRRLFRSLQGASSASPCCTIAPLLTSPPPPLPPSSIALYAASRSCESEEWTPPPTPLTPLADVGASSCSTSLSCSGGDAGAPLRAISPKMEAKTSASLFLLSGAARQGAACNGNCCGCCCCCCCGANTAIGAAWGDACSIAMGDHGGSMAAAGVAGWPKGM